MKFNDLLIGPGAAFAPMAGLSDAPARRLMAQHGAAYTTSEMVSAKALCYHDQKTLSLMKLFPGEHPAAVQLFAGVAIQRW